MCGDCLRIIPENEWSLLRALFSTFEFCRNEVEISKFKNTLQNCSTQFTVTSFSNEYSSWYKCMILLL